MTIPSAQITKGYTDTLLRIQTFFFIYRANFSYFVISSASVLGRLRVTGPAITTTIAALFSLSMSTVSGLLKSAVVSVMVDLSQFKTMSADSSTGSGLCPQNGGIFL